MRHESADVGQNSVIDLVNRAACLYNGGLIDEATSEFQAIHSEYPSNVVVRNYLFFCHFHKGNERFQAGDADGSIFHFGKANAFMPGHEQAVRNLLILCKARGKELLEQGETERALSLLELADSLAHDHAVVRNLLFLAHSQRGMELIDVSDYAGAIMHYERAEALLPGNRLVQKALLLLYNQQTTLLCAQGRIEEAQPLLDRTLAIDPDNEAARACLCTYHFLQSVDRIAQQESGAALPHLEQLSILCRTRPFPKREMLLHIYHRATAHYSGQEYDRAAHYFKLILSIRMEDPEIENGVLYNSCIFFSLSTHHLDCFENFVAFSRKTFLGTRTAETDAWMATMCRHAALVMFDYNHYRDCIPFLERVLEISPSDVSVWNRLAAATLAVGDHIDAIRHFRSSVAHGPGQTEVPYRLAQVLSLIKGKEITARFCRHVLKSHPANILVTKELASTAQALPTSTTFNYYPFPRYVADRSVWVPSPGQMARKLRVLCLGPCQGFGISRFLDRMLQLVRAADILYVSTGQPHLCKLYIEKYARHADVIVYRKITSSSASQEEMDAYAVMNAEVRDDALMVSYPAMELWSLWGINFFTDRIDTGRRVKELLRTESNIHEICRAYDAGELDFDFSRRHRDLMAILKFTERYTDVKIHDYINENIRHKILFTFGTHPAKSLYLECVRQVYEKMFEAGIVQKQLSDPDALYEDWPDDIIHPAEFFPIDKYSRDHFGLTWCTDEQVRQASGYYHMLLQMARNFFVTQTQAEHHDSGAD